MPSRSFGHLLAAFGLVSFGAAGPVAFAQSPSPDPSGTAAAAQPASSYAPVRGQSGKDVIWIATPDAVVNRMLQMAEVSPQDRVVDLGSGDGKIAIAAARNHGARAQGLEFNPQMVELSNRLAREAGVADKATFQRADIFATDFSSATVVTMYLLPELNLRLRPILFGMTPGTRVVSHSFPMGDWEPDETARSGTADVYLWRIPANVAGRWKLTASGLPGAPDNVQFTQKFQQLQGDAAFGALTAGLVQPQVSGPTLTFRVRDASGEMLHFTGRADGNRIAGTVARGTAAPVSFEAVRSEKPQSIASAPQSPRFAGPQE